MNKTENGKLQQTGITPVVKYAQRALNGPNGPDGPDGRLCDLSVVFYLLKIQKKAKREQLLLAKKIRVH